ncbi:hypothetical protein C8R45DRAFT_559128 [Mycena sanguinolenta]|nr:hypothetical protein C8R45DRAFT_559128 [Mycena sanguinolenta]
MKLRFKSGVPCAQSSCILVLPPLRHVRFTRVPVQDVLRLRRDGVFKCPMTARVRCCGDVWDWCVVRVGFVKLSSGTRPFPFPLGTLSSQLHTARQLDLRAAQHERHHRRPAAFASSSTSGSGSSGSGLLRVRTLPTAVAASAQPHVRRLRLEVPTVRKGSARGAGGGDIRWSLGVVVVNGAAVRNVYCIRCYVHAMYVPMLYSNSFHRITSSPSLPFYALKPFKLKPL